MQKDSRRDKLVVSQGGKIQNLGKGARDNIRAYNDDIREALKSVEFLHYEVLACEFGPSDTEFLIPAQLVIPLDEILYNDELFWYSSDGEVIEPIELDYFVDYENKTVHLLIDQFSQYYYPRR